MVENQLVALSKQFAVDMILLCDTMKTRNKAKMMDELGYDVKFTCRKNTK